MRAPGWPQPSPTQSPGGKRKEPGAVASSITQQQIRSIPMALSTTNSGAILKPEAVDELLVIPTLAQSVAAQVAKVIHTSASSLRLPIVAADPSAAWTAEGAEIAVSDQDLDEVAVPFYALKGLTVVSNELIADSSPEASQLVGEGLARDAAKKLDAAFFGTTVTNGPSGLGALSGVQSVDAGDVLLDLDAFHTAISKAQDVGATVAAFVTNPATALELALVKRSSTPTDYSNENLLQPDPHSPLKWVIAGVPLLVSSAVAANTIWAIPFQRTVIGLRKNVEVVSDASAYFSKDSTAIRSVMRVGIGFPHAEAVVKIQVTP
ncbi:phage major capsid protein [Rhodococcus sp. T2V]|uniref:phage major capsid protein n=1 Tax=Rhodococcus sp. T2V TaxID=3034164 RepID=UPI0023E1D5FC|nr:phage major capsid protein [Rhodococcus sp. T2V]MDF3307859.1 phage major capsid protein [Rhodococcus sp. T2V]